MNYTQLREEDKDFCTSDNTYNINGDNYAYKPGHVVMTTIVLPIIFCVGFIINVAFIYVALRIERMRIVTNVYLINLAIADIIFLAAAIGDKVWKYVSSPVMGEDSPLGAIGCIWVYFLIDMAYFASLIFITVVSLYRYVAVCLPQKRNYFKTNTKIFIAGSWLLACLLAASLIPAYSDMLVYCFLWPDVEPYRQWPSVIRFCGPINIWIGDYSAGLQSIPFFISSVVNIYLYASIIIRLNQWSKNTSYSGVAKADDIASRRQISWMLVVNGIVFFCLLAPFEFMSFFRMIASLRGGSNGYIFLLNDPTARTYLTWLSRICSYINSALNPLIYAIMCKSYREAFTQAFVPKCCVNKEFQQINNNEHDEQKDTGPPTQSNTVV